MDDSRYSSIGAKVFAINFKAKCGSVDALCEIFAVNQAFVDDDVARHSCFHRTHLNPSQLTNVWQRCSACGRACEYCQGAARYARLGLKTDSDEAYDDTIMPGSCTHTVMRRGKLFEPTQR